jgi:hypothetical protein
MYIDQLLPVAFQYSSSTPTLLFAKKRIALATRYRIMISDPRCLRRNVNGTGASCRCPPSLLYAKPLAASSVT